MNGFFWGSGSNGKGISWLAWDKLCSPKAGGLGVKNLKNFNTAMLAKQGWRILNNINPLVTTIMKARYFPNVNFLNVELGTNPSYVWRSIVSAQEALRAGSRIKIGNGEFTNVWTTQWLPDHDNGFMTTEMPTQLQNITVRNLMCTEGTRWDLDVLRDICNDIDFELIKRIPIPAVEVSDSWFWIKDEKGLFTVKSFYRWLQGEFSSDYASFWKRLWSLKVPGKVSNFMWRVCRGCLPTANALAMKQVDIDVFCPWCHREVETDGHVLFGCEYARTVWQSSDVKTLVQFAPGDTVVDVLTRYFSVCTREQGVLIRMIGWSIWNRRNKWVWERVNRSVFSVLAAARNLLHDWREAQSLARSFVTQTLNLGLKNWRKPPDGWVKINCDASGVVNGCIGIGCVIRDYQGRFVGARCRKIEGKWHPREAEVISLKEAILWTKTLDLQGCRFETDSQVLARACNGQNGESYFHTIVSDCIRELKHIDQVLVGFVYRSTNCVAHLLANAAHSMSDCGEWLVTPPEFINHVLESDNS